MNQSYLANLPIFRSLFGDREDLFAVRLEKKGKATYFPSYDYDPYQFRLHKIKGGTLQTFLNKTLSSLSNYQIEKHLNGEHFIGIYPLQKDNTSWFIAADFDKAEWIEDCRLLIQFCEKNGLPTYLERSRSGKGGHVWIFFERPYPAVKSRKIIFRKMMNAKAAWMDFIGISFLSDDFKERLIKIIGERFYRII